MKFDQPDLALEQNHDNYVECVCCGWMGAKFLPCPYGSTPRRGNSLCPTCGSLERHRLSFLFLRDVIPKVGEIKVLHFAPELALKKLFMSYSNVKYVSVDLYEEEVMFKEDITQLSFTDNSFDIIFCSHVLEHVGDDIRAMSEMCRVLKPDGFAIIQVPIHHYMYNGTKLENTFEDSTVVDPEKRALLFGQKDHVRLYGHDFKDRLMKVGFSVDIKKFINLLDPLIVKRYMLLPEGDKSEENGWIYFCTKND